MTWPLPIRLAELLERARADDIPPGWLYLPKDWRTWNADTAAFMIDVLDDGEYDQTEAHADKLGYGCTIDDQTLADIVRAAHEHLEVDALESRLAARGETSVSPILPPLTGAKMHFLERSAEFRHGLLEALIYYCRFDAFLPQLGAPDPPPWEETQRQLDRAFYDALGAEREGVPCREPACDRGAVKLSVLCKVHHFAQVQRRVCPFSD